MGNHRALKMAAGTLSLLAGAAVVTLGAYRQEPVGVIPEGVQVAGIALGGKTTEQARAALETWRDARRGETVVLALPPEYAHGRQWSPKRADLGLDVDVDATLAAAQDTRRGRGPIERIGEWLRGVKPTDVAPCWKTDDAALRRYLKRRIAPRVAKEPKDARFLALPTGFRIAPEVPGTALDVEAAAKAVEEQGTRTDAGTIVMPVRVARPHVAAADLKGIEGEVSRFRTHYSETGNRRKNIEVACSHINGTVLKPGDKFSYNKIVGPRDADSGFRIAPVIIRGRLQPGMGGGVCQVSSTLYNAVLLADLKIVRRTHHAFPVHYLPAGRDATVAYDSVDFQFENDTTAPIAIAASASDQQVVMRVFGKRVPGREVTIQRTNVSSWGQGTETVHDSSLPVGSTRTVERGHAGHRVTVWRVVKVGGQQVKREVVSRDHYDAFPRIVAVGPRPATPRVAPPSTAPGPAVPAVAPPTPGGGSVPGVR